MLTVCNKLHLCVFGTHYVFFSASVLISRIWDFKTSHEAIEVVKHHSEFVYGLDFNNHVPGELADCGWDSLVHVFSPSSLAGLSLSEPR